LYEVTNANVDAFGDDPVTVTAFEFFGGNSDFNMRSPSIT
jgi:hypothetical protein